MLNAATPGRLRRDDPSLLALVVIDFVLVFLFALVPPRLVLVLVVRHFLPLLEHVGLGLVVGDPGGHKRLFEVLGVVIGVLVVRVLILRITVRVSNDCEFRIR